MRVAVIGAGFSGMLAAYLLEKEGIQVTVYEKDESLGGHCKTLASKDMFIELGSVFSFRDHIKELLVELQLDYIEKFTYRNFLDDQFKSVEQIAAKEVSNLLKEIEKLKSILQSYNHELESMNYGYIPEELLMPLYDFLEKHDMMTICQVLAPHLSSYGYGNIKQLQAYYAFKVFNVETINAFIRGEKLLFIKQGMSELIRKLSHNITDIRYSIEVKNIEVSNNQVLVETFYDKDVYDKVFITTKLPRDVIKDDLYNTLMKKIDTNPFITCAYEVANLDLVTTYYKNNLGVDGKIQFFHPVKDRHRAAIVAYTYGKVSKELVTSVTQDIQNSDIHIKHLIAAKQWFIFPHIKLGNLTSEFYAQIHDRQRNNPINLIGSLICEPSLSRLYVSVKQTVQNFISNI